MAICLLIAFSSLQNNGYDMFGFFKSISAVNAGRKVGNAAADYIGMDRGLYHTAMELGRCENHMLVLSELNENGCSLDEVATFSFQFLVGGLDVLEQRYGIQPKIAQARRMLQHFSQTKSQDGSAARLPHDNSAVETELPKSEDRFTEEPDDSPYAPFRWFPVKLKMMLLLAGIGSVEESAFTFLSNKKAAGYLFGWHDAEIQIFRISDMNEALGLMHWSYMNIFGKGVGDSLFAQAISLQEDSDFIEGRNIGGKETMECLRPGYVPVALAGIIKGR